MKQNQQVIDNPRATNETPAVPKGNPIRFFVELRHNLFSVIDRNTNQVHIACTTLKEAQAHARGLNR